MATSLDVLADLLIELDKLQEAEKALRRSLAIWLHAAGLKHPSSLKTLNLLAELLERMGNRNLALELRNRAERAVHPSEILSVPASSGINAGGPAAGRRKQSESVQQKGGGSQAGESAAGGRAKPLREEEDEEEEGR